MDIGGILIMGSLGQAIPSFLVLLDQLSGHTRQIMGLIYPLETFGPLGRFCLWDVFVSGKFCPLGRFVPWDFCPMGRFVLGRFVCASIQHMVLSVYSPVMYSARLFDQPCNLYILYKLLKCIHSIPKIIYIVV